MESQGRVPGHETDDGINQGSDIRVCSGVCKTSLPGSESRDLLGQGGTLTAEQRNATGYKQIDVEFLRDLHELSIHNFNEAKGDFPLGFWNGYGCALKTVIEKLEQSS